MALCAHLYEHYLFTHDRVFLGTPAPIPLMKSSARNSASPGSSRTAKAISPLVLPFSTENDFIAPDGKRAMTSAGCTMDMALIRELFGNCIAASKDARHRQRSFAAKAGRCPPAPHPLSDRQAGASCRSGPSTSRRATPGQRHMSHMYPLYPGNQITPRHNSRSGQRPPASSLERRLAQWRSLHRMEPRLGHYGFWARLGRWRQSLGVALHAHAAQHQHQSLRHASRETRGRSSRSTVTSVRPRPSRRCCCRATRNPSIYCPPCLRRGQRAKSKACARAAGSK
jgi:hypothetical protein